ncbi:Abi family protein [Kocuria palustris]|uniref:Abi family protein n=1 Tax=Kocuria palustris TaxID=71999 RepID=UPI000738E21E|nr:Abi family protein [Kocuria palustris]KUG55004.1 hypothetical protein AVL60_01315 [Kocuria palustris]
MVAYDKPWLSVEDQISRLRSHGLVIDDDARAAQVLSSIGYYRLTGYLYPFRVSEPFDDETGRRRIRVLSDFRPGTHLTHAEEIIVFDRHLRMLALDGLERVEVAFRMRTGYVLGRRSPFAHEDPTNFTSSFTSELAEDGSRSTSKHEQWVTRVRERQQKSDEQFVQHFHDAYDGRMPIWALTEIMELGHLSTLYRGLNQADAEEIAHAFGVPTKKLMTSWLGSLNYVRNVSAHHARLFNRKLQNAPGRPGIGQIPVLDHLRESEDANRVFGTYSVLAVIAYLLSFIDPYSDWAERLADLLQSFPASDCLSVESLGAPQAWESLDLWRS